MYFLHYCQSAKSFISGIFIVKLSVNVFCLRAFGNEITRIIYEVFPDWFVDIIFSESVF